MNNSGKIVLMVMAALFMAISFYAFVNWFAYLSHDVHLAANGQAATFSSVSEAKGMFLFFMFSLPFAFGIISFLSYRHKRRIEGF